jgi:HTH-type transcriptional regulator/antitoxin HipB
MDFPLHFADQLQQHIRALRKARNLTQAQLAHKLGVGQSRMADIEANPSAVSVEHLFKILAALDAQLVLRDSGATTTRDNASRTKRTTKKSHRATSGDEPW